VVDLVCVFLLLEGLHCGYGLHCRLGCRRTGNCKTVEWPEAQWSDQSLEEGQGRCQSISWVELGCHSDHGWSEVPPGFVNHIDWGGVMSDY